MAGGNKDTRIVELQFKNQEFERNIAKSTKNSSIHAAATEERFLENLIIASAK